MKNKPRNVEELLDVIESLQWCTRHMILELSLVAAYLDEVDEKYNCYGMTELEEIGDIIEYIDSVMGCYDGLEVNINLYEEIGNRLKHKYFPYQH